MPKITPKTPQTPKVPAFDREAWRSELTTWSTWDLREYIAEHPLPYDAEPDHKGFLRPDLWEQRRREKFDRTWEALRELDARAHRHIDTMHTILREAVANRDVDLFQRACESFEAMPTAFKLMAFHRYLPVNNHTEEGSWPLDDFIEDFLVLEAEAVKLESAYRA